jgi:AcrR family transcriptional regulator
MGIIERKEREKEQRREEILDAAEKVFFEKGLAAATMDEIAEIAELGKSTLYLYYKSKEDLYLAVTMRGGEHLYAMLKEAALTNEPSVKRVWNMGEAYLAFFNQYRHYFRMYYFLENSQLHSQVSPEMSEQCAMKDEKIWGVVVQTIQQAIDEGFLKADVNPMQAAVMFWSNCNGLMRQMDRSDDYWKRNLNVNLEDTMRKGNMLLMEGMMTAQGKREFGKAMKEQAAPWTA